MITLYYQPYNINFINSLSCNIIPRARFLNLLIKENTLYSIYSANNA
jgi:hypothetical protein